jgi:3-oxoacyl-[acyl-carrier protein] reductase
VNVISPGAIDTEMISAARREKAMDSIAMGRIGTPDEVAEAAMFLISPAASYCNGANLAVSGGR